MALAMTGFYPSDAPAGEPSDETLGGVIIMRNCPKSEIRNFSFRPSHAEKGGWAEITKDDQRVRIHFNSWTPDDLKKFNRLGNQIEPKIRVMVYYGDFLFLVKSKNKTLNRLPEGDSIISPSRRPTHPAV